MKEKRFIFAFGFFIILSISYSQSISFTNPSNGEVFNLGEIVEIEWEVSNLRGSIDIEYSTDKNKWNLITQISALEGLFIWDTDLENIPNNDNGIIFIRLSQSMTSKIREIKIPQLANKGEIVFLSLNNKLKDEIEIRLSSSRKNYKVDEIISLYP